MNIEEMLEVIPTISGGGFSKWYKFKLNKKEKKLYHDAFNILQKNFKEERKKSIGNELKSLSKKELINRILKR